MTEFHDLGEISLNSEDEAWGNLGYWKDESEYSAACHALALLLGDAAELGMDSIVFDAGFGCGDQLLLWRDHYKVAQIFGINYSKSQTEFAKNRLQCSGSGFEPDVVPATLQYGDATDPRAWSFQYPVGKPDRILALDCAYHFPSRTAFWKLSARYLQSGGKIAVTDLMLSDDHQPKSLKHRLLLWMLARSQIPAANMVNEDIYVEQMRQAGFENINLSDISEQVMPEFGNWWRSYRKGADGRQLPWRSRIKYEITARFLDWAWRKQVLRYCLASGEKP